MRTAPPVDYPVARSGFWHCALMALCLLAGGCVGLTWAQCANQPAWPAVTLTAAVLAVAVFRHWYRQQAQAPVLRLRWTGQTWQLWEGQTTNPIAHIDLVHDVDAAALLRGHDTHGRVLGWWPVCRCDAPHDWHRLRLALCDTQRRPPAAPGGTPA